MSYTNTKVVLVTGGSSGIGEAIAKSFAKQGACLSLIAVDETNFDEVVQECKDSGAKEVLKIVTNLIEKENMEMAMKETIDKFGRLDVLINCAGGGAFGTIRDLKLEDFDTTISLNARTPLYMMQLAVPYLEKTKGRIVNISSVSSFLSSPNVLLSYIASKAALDRITKVAALDLASSGIRVNTVNPTACDTTSFRLAAPMMGMNIEEMKKNQGELQPLNKRVLEPQEVADAAIFLASDEASMITGINLPVDGGRLLGEH